MSLLLRGGIAIIGAALMSGCLGGHPAIPADGVIDGWPVAAKAKDGCASDHVTGAEQGGCAQRLSLAVAGLDRRDPGHASVVRIVMYEEAPVFARSGGRPEVAVIELDDGTIRAIGVGTAGGISRRMQAFDYGPMGKPLIE